MFLSFSVVESLTAVTSGVLSPSSCQRRLSVSAEKVHASVKRQLLLKKQASDIQLTTGTCNITEMNILIPLIFCLFFGENLKVS